MSTFPYPLHEAYPAAKAVALVRRDEAMLPKTAKARAAMEKEARNETPGR